MYAASLQKTVPETLKGMGASVENMFADILSPIRRAKENNKNKVLIIYSSDEEEAVASRGVKVN